ncbi:MAG: A/G-specific adenine glycosylase [Acidobacteriota bacterium]|nr:A/G-specific adenine glycosylase [Acidobacteriota bacterium]
MLVSEVMLQQTQARRVVAPFVAFMARFPTPARCAEAPLAEVVLAWAGLGYNRRAAHLHGAARSIVADHGGVVPDRLDDLEALPGVGSYTARAVLAFAYERDVAVVDVNVARVLARAVVGAPLGTVAVQTLADALVPDGRGWRWNQTLMEIGATSCTGRAPRCADCPLGRCCAWAGAGRPEPDPGRPGRRQSPFEGSDRQGRGRLVSALRRGPVPAAALAAACGWPQDGPRAERMACALVADGLARRGRTGTLRLA